MITKNTEKDKIILGVDPGTNLMGYALLSVKGANKLTLLQFGVIHLKKYDNHALKLQKIFERIISVIDEYLPDEMAIEEPFLGKNIQSMLKLGRAQGVAMAAALSRNIQIVEYAPKKVKQAVTGNGNASKEQVAEMLKREFKFEATPEFLDATDAVGVALCQEYQKGNNRTTKQSWGAFVKQNVDRIK